MAAPHAPSALREFVKLRPEVEAELFRIAQEAMNNAVKHARATAIDVRCQVYAPDARIIVALWAAEGDLARPSERLAHLGVDAVVARVADAIKEIQKDPTRIPADGDQDRPARQSARKG